MFHMRAVLLMVLMLLASALAVAQNSGQTGSTVTVDLVAKNVAFNTNTITVPAGANVIINFDNQDSGVTHNFAVYTDSSASNEIFKGDVITGPKTTTYTFTAPTTPGTYLFRCDIHPTIMNGQFIVSSAGSVSTSPTTAPANGANATSTAQPSPYTAPGFEGIFAVTGLMAIAYIVLGRKQ